MKEKDQKQAENTDDTIPVNINPENENSASEETKQTKVDKKPSRKSRKKKGPNIVGTILLGLLAIAVLAAIGGYIGYSSGLSDRVSQENDQVTYEAVRQYQLALEDLQANRLEIARQRIEYVIQIDPSFPGAAEQLTNVMLYMAETSAPTPAPTETPIPVTPTPDFRSVEDKFATAESVLKSGDWNGAIEALYQLREEDLLYRAVEVDGMFYIALRHRGMEKIISGQLEEGIYDLALAEQFGPLDNEADNLRTWARYYITGASFWKVDWERVIQIFGEIYPLMPNLHDSSGYTAQERYRVAALEYARELEYASRWCDSEYYYNLSLSIINDPTIAEKVAEIHLLCEPPEPTAMPTPEVTATTEPTGEGGEGQGAGETETTPDP